MTQNNDIRRILLADHRAKARRLRDNIRQMDDEAARGVNRHASTYAAVSRRALAWHRERIAILRNA